jgi:hypothetical protein
MLEVIDCPLLGVLVTGLPVTCTHAGIELELSGLCSAHTTMCASVVLTQSHNSALAYFDVIVRHPGMVVDISTSLLLYGDRNVQRVEEFLT